MRLLCTSLCLLLAISATAEEEKKEKKKKEKPPETPVFTSADDPNLPVDYAFQGEYNGKLSSGEKLGAQVIALGKGMFQAVLFPGGLPGDGWDRQNRIIMKGEWSRREKIVFFTPIDGRESLTYLHADPPYFSAVKSFPPMGQKKAHASSNGKFFKGKTEDELTFDLEKVVRQSPTINMKPPQDALILFEGKNTEALEGGRLDEVTKLLNTDGKDIRTKKSFLNYTVHVEFMLPFRPEARGQGRGNSGFYQVDQYEVQILDSFGLEGLDNECGGIYQQFKPKLNMCYPPLTWQTYDIEFDAAVVEGENKKKNPRLTVRHNGVVIHNDIELDKGVTGGARTDPTTKKPAAEGTPGPLRLQGHNNPLQFKNWWIVERK